MCPQESGKCGLIKSSRSTVGQGSTRVSESFTNFNLRMLLVLLTSLGNWGWYGQCSFWVRGNALESPLINGSHKVCVLATGMFQVGYTTLSSFLATRRTVVFQPGNDGNHAEKRCTKLKAYSNLMKCGSWKKPIWRCSKCPWNFDSWLCLIFTIFQGLCVDRWQVTWK